jgi:glycosyltransferase involved in cell wall biosynthesis
MKKKLVIITTVPISLKFFKGQIGVLKDSFDVELISSPGPELVAIGISEGVTVHAVPMKRNVSILSDIISVFTLARVLSKIKPDMVHGSTPKAGLLSMLVSFFLRVKVRVYYLHGLRYDGLSGKKKSLLKYLERVSCSCATHVYAVSLGVREHLHNDKITTKPIQIIHNGSVNGLDLEYFDRTSIIKDENTLKSGDFVYGFVGRLVKDKGINELVSAFVRINKTYLNTRLVLVGQYENELDPLLAVTKKEIEENENIIFRGFQSDVRPALCEFDVFVFPSYREGFGVSLMEALAMEVPAISSNIIGCNEIIIDGYNGLFISPKNEEDLYEKMRKIYEDKDLYVRLKTNCRDHITAKYDQSKLWESTLESYKYITQ